MESLYISPKFSLHSDPESHWPFFSLLLQCQREIHPQHSQKFPPRAILLQMVFLLLPRSKKKQHNNTLAACFPATSRGVSWMGDLTRFERPGLWEFLLHGFWNLKSCRDGSSRPGSVDQLSISLVGPKRIDMWWHARGLLYRFVYIIKKWFWQDFQ